MLANTAVSSPSSTIRTRPSTKFSDSLRNRSTWESPSRTSIAGVQPALLRSPTVCSTWPRAPEVSTSSNTIRRSPEIESMMPASSALLPRKLSAKPFIMAGPKFRFTLGVTPMASPIGLRSTWPMSLDWANAVELSSRVENNKVRNALFISVSPFMVVWSFGRLVVWSFGRLVVSKRQSDETTKRRKGLSRAVGPFEIRPNVSGIRQLGQPEVGDDETLPYFPAGQHSGALSGAIDGVERQLQLGQVTRRRGDDGRRPCRRLQHQRHHHRAHQGRRDAQQPWTTLLCKRGAARSRLDAFRKLGSTESGQFMLQCPIGGQLGIARGDAVVLQRDCAFEIPLE